MIEVCIQSKLEGTLSTNNNGGCLLALPFVASFAMLFLIGFLGFATVSSTETSMPDAAPPAEAEVSSSACLLFVVPDAPTATEINLVDAPAADAAVVTAVASGFKPYVVGQSVDGEWLLVYYFANEVPATAWASTADLAISAEQLGTIIVLDPTALPDFTMLGFAYVAEADIATLGE